MSDLPAAYYASGRTGWRAWWTLLHPPYTLMHLSFVVMGGALAPQVNVRDLLATLLAFFLAVGVTAHALDEVVDRPLGTEIPKSTLLIVAIIALAMAAGIGITGMMVSNVHIGWFIVAGVFLSVSYSLELFRGLFHSDLWFGLAWGVFPLLTAHFAQTGTLNIIAVLGAAYALAMSLTQRRLSTPARRLRRSVESVHGTITLRDGTSIAITRPMLLQPLERTLRLLVTTSILIAAALLVMRLADGEWIAGL